MEVEWLKKSVARCGGRPAGAHRPRSSSSEHLSPMRTHRPQPLDLLSRPGDRVGGESPADAADRRAVPRGALLRESADGGAAGRRSVASGSRDSWH
jgi:hypothetical protein